jgi:hypothetical protein
VTEMSPEEKALARMKFQNAIYRSDGQAFEDLFVSIMSSAYSGFKAVKPQGKFGDRKNDGYVRDQGVYYQVYAPEDIKTSVGAACKKIADDFDGLKKYWDTISPIRDFYFVLNDKYKGTFPEIEKVLAGIETNHDLNKCESFLAKNLEDELFNLPDDVILSVIGFVPNPAKIDTLDYSLLTEVVQYILEQKGKLDLTQDLTAPDFNEKICFNGLGPETRSLLVTASFQVGILEGFFELNSNFMKQELRNIVRGMYEDSKKKDCGGDSNVIFIDVLRSITPKQDAHSQEAALVVMSYFFESCDIFENPA